MVTGHRMSELSNRPLVCVALAFAAGIALTTAIGPAALWLTAAATVIGVLGWGWRRGPGWLGAALLGTGALAGACALCLAEVRGGADVSLLPEGGQTLVGTVAGAPRYSDGLWRFVLAVESHQEHAGSEPVSGRVYVRLVSSKPVARGERWRLVGRLRPLREARNPGGRSEAAALASLGVSGTFMVGAEELAERVGEGRLGLVSAHAYRAQQAALELLGRHVSGPYRELSARVAASVVFGVHAAPPPAEITELFRRAGTIHLLVVSGAMVSMLFGLVFLPGALGAGWRRVVAERQSALPLSGRGRIRHWPGLGAAIAAVLVVTYYAVLTEGGQAVARAAIVGCLVGGAFALRRVPAVARQHGLNLDRYTLLATAAAGILAVAPRSLLQPGFQLSFAAVWAIIYLTPKAAPRLRGLPRWVALLLVGTTAAQLATFPILAWHYGQAPIAGFGANLLAVPLASFVLVGGILTCALGTFAPWAAGAAGWMTGVCARGMVWATALFGSLPWASLEVHRPGWPILVGWYGGMVLLGSLLARVGARGSGER